MKTAIAKVDSTGAYYAALVARQGKTEVQIYPLQNDADKGVSVCNSLASVFVLESEDDVLSLEWVTTGEVSNGKRSKRRQSNGAVSGSSSSSYLACVLKSGRIKVFSPFQDHSISEFEAGSPIVASCSSRSYLWVSTDSEIIGFDVNSGKPKNTVKYPKAVTQVTSIATVDGGDEQLFVVLGEKSYLVNKAGELVHTFEVSKASSSVLLDNSATIAISKGEDVILFTGNNFTETNTLSLNSQIKTLHYINDTTIAALLKTGAITIVNLAAQSSSAISSNNKKIPLNLVFYQAGDVIVSYTGVVPEFQGFKLDSCTENITIDVKQATKQSKVKKITEPIVFELKAVEEYNVRESKLVTLIQDSIDNVEELFRVLISNDSEDKMGYVSSAISPEIAVQVFDVLSARVQCDPSESSILNTWLKWILVNHSSVINSQANLKPLNGALKKGLKQLPDLLALQGRLELLRSQLVLREQISKRAEENAIASKQQNHRDAISQAEESIVYVNGENDEADDDVLEAAGNTESEQESEDVQAEDEDVHSEDDDGEQE